VVRDPRRVFQRLRPERCVEAYYLRRTRFESIAERKLRQAGVGEDGNPEIKVEICEVAKWEPHQGVGSKGLDR
jgi:hypothetical protein